MWIKSSEDISIISLPQGEITNSYKGVWELEDGSRLVDPVQVVSLKKPPKVVFLLKAKSDSPTMANKLIIKSLDLEKNKFKFYDADKLIPNSRLS